MVIHFVFPEIVQPKIAQFTPGILDSLTSIDWPDNITTIPSLKLFKIVSCSADWAIVKAEE